MDLPFLADTLQKLLAGVPLMLYLASVSLVVGLALAILLAYCQVSAFRPLAWLAQAYVFVFRGTPLLVQLFLVYYGLGQFRPALQEIGIWWFFRDPTYCVLTALTLNTAAYAAEIVRGGLQSVPPGQIEAARAFGMTGPVLLRRIIGPIALRQALPAYGNEMILMVKATSLASTVTLMEVTGTAQKLISQTFRVMEIFICAGAIYLLVNFVLTRLIAIAERRLSPDRVRSESAATAPRPAAALAH